MGEKRGKHTVKWDKPGNSMTGFCVEEGQSNNLKLANQTWIRRSDWPTLWNDQEKSQSINTRTDLSILKDDD